MIPTPNELANFLIGKDVTWRDGKIDVHNAELFLKAVGNLVVTNLMPSTIDKLLWTRSLAELVYYIVQGRYIDFCGLIIRQMISVR